MEVLPVGFTLCT